MLVYQRVNIFPIGFHLESPNQNKNSAKSWDYHGIPPHSANQKRRPVTFCGFGWVMLNPYNTHYSTRYIPLHIPPLFLLNLKLLFFMLDIP